MLSEPSMTKIWVPLDYVRERPQFGYTIERTEMWAFIYLISAVHAFEIVEYRFQRQEFHKKLVVGL